MKYNIYAIKDTKIGFMQPFIQPNDFVAEREFKNIVNSGSSVVSQNYSDMELHSLGSYDMNSGEIVSDVKFIVNGITVKEGVSSDDKNS